MIRVRDEQSEKQNFSDGQRGGIVCGFQCCKERSGMALGQTIHGDKGETRIRPRLTPGVPWK